MCVLTQAYVLKALVDKTANHIPACQMETSLPTNANFIGKLKKKREDSVFVAVIAVFIYVT